MSSKGSESVCVSQACFALVLIFLLCFVSTEEGSGLEENGFSWGDYLEETGTRAAPHSSFRHVCQALNSLLACGREGEGSVG